MTVAWWAWVAVIAFIVAMLAVDLMLHRDAHEIATREALTWSAIWVAIALAFGGVLWATLGSEAAGSYYAGWLIEKSLSVDNLFVFALLFSFFAVPVRVPAPRVVLGRARRAACSAPIFIFAGAALLESFHWMIFVFGAFLVFTGVKLLRSSEIGVSPDRNPVLQFMRRRVRMTPEFHEDKFFVRKDGLRWATPLLAVLIVVETTDVLFAVDSIPAIFAVTTNTFIVFTSNAFAILGLRALYFLLAGVLDRFHYLKAGLAAVLVFVGVKMLVSDWYHVPIWASLLVITALIGGSIAFSLRKTAGESGATPLPGATDSTGG